MRSLARMSVVELKDVIRTCPNFRAAAWAELKFRNEVKQAWNAENFGATAARTPKAAVQVLLDDLGVKPWNPPDLSDPEPPREGPMV